MDIKKGDMVYILKGALRKHEGKTEKESGGKRKRVGKVLHVDRKKNTYLVEGFNMMKRHTRPTQKNPQGGIIVKEAPIHRSKIALYSEELGAPTRIGCKVTEGPDGKKKRVRVCAKTRNEI